MVEKQFCVQCGTALQAEDKFCPKCGAPIHGVGTQTRAQSRNRTNRRRQRGWQINVRALSVVGIVLLFLVGIFLVLKPSNQVPAKNAEPEDVHDASGIPYPEVPRISVTDAKARFDTKTALFVDVRSQGEYDTAHIPNAKLLSLADLQSRYRELPTNQEILLYCT